MEKKTVQKESTIKDFLEVIFRRKWIILGVVLVSTTLVIGLNLRESAIFESTGKMLVRRGEASGVFNNNVRTLTWEEEISSQIEMVKSQVVIDRARELVVDFLPEGYSSSEKIDFERVQSGVIATSNVLWVSYSGLHPVFCEASVNAIINSYKEYYQMVRTPPEMEDFFSSEMNSVKTDIEYWRERKTRMEKKWGLVDIQSQVRNTLTRLEGYRSDLDEVRDEKIQLVGIIENLEEFESVGVEQMATITSVLTGDLNRKSKLEQYTEQLVKLRISESELAVKYTDDHMEMKTVRWQIEDVLSYMEVEIQASVEIQKKRLDIVTSREENLVNLMAVMDGEKISYPEKEGELHRINKTLEILEERLDLLQEQHLNSRINMASNPEWSITILAPATRAYQKKTRDYVRMALGPLFSLIIALGFAFFMDNLDHSIKNVNEAEDALGFQVLSSFPDLDSK
ncbi:MAG: hypothetical protein KAV42_07290 [Candidatus Krumholzibacteria bacterium]|nr:hypothetical protein [Candidatus Krumholzibacteria bacterium]